MYAGVAIIIGSAVLYAYSANLLNGCWMLMIEREPEELEGGLKSAYPHLAEYIAGKIARYIWFSS